MPKFQSKYYLFIPVSMIFFCFLFLVMPLDIALNFANDDSFFYLKISKNLADGLGITFDGLSKTSGFHPLYMLLGFIVYFKAAIFSVQTPEALYRIICILHIVIIHSIAFAGYLYFRNKENGGVKFAIFAIASAGLIFIRDFGVESHVSCLLFLLFFMNKAHEQNVKRIVYGAALISLLFLSRTDYLWSLVPALIYADYNTSDIGMKKKVLAYDLAFIVTIASAYYAFNFLYFGNAIPVTAAVLSSFPSTVFLTNAKDLITNPGFLANQTARIFLFASGFIFAAAAVKTKRNEIKILFYAAAGLVLNLLVHLFFNRYNIREWYVTLPLFVVIIFISVYYGAGKKFLNTAIISILVLFTVSAVYLTRLNSSKWKSSYEYSKKLEEATQESDRIFMFDYSGVVSFFSNRSVVNGDGFVNDYEYLGYLKNGKIPDYIRSKKINYVSTIIRDSLTYGADKTLVFTNEPFLNPLGITKDRIKLVSGFGFKTSGRDSRGKFVLINTEGL